MGDGSQKFIARNRAPRVQIEYDVELYGAEKKVQLPFVMGVMSDLAGKSNVAQPAIEDRKFLEIDTDTFDERMKAMKPRVAFSVPNTLTGEGNLDVDLTFESIDDFTPGATAGKVDALKPLLEARTQLMNLTAYMDGKAGAEALIEKILADPALLTGLGSGAASENADAALAALRATAPEEDAPTDAHADTLDALRAVGAPETEDGREGVTDVLSGLAAQAPEQAVDSDSSGDVLDGLRASDNSDPDEADTTDATLAHIAAQAPEDTAEPDETGAALSSLANAEVAEPQADTTSQALSALAASAPQAPVIADATGDVLDDLAAAAPDDAIAEDPLAALQSLDPVEQEPAEDTTADALSSLAGMDPIADEKDTSAEVLEGLATAPAPEPDPADTTDDLLGDLAAAAPEETEAENPLAALDSLGTVETAPAETEDSPEAVLSDLADAKPAKVEEDTSADVLNGLTAAPAPEPELADTTDDLLDDLAAAAPEETEAEDPLAALDSLGAVEAASVEVGNGTEATLTELAATEPAEVDDGSSADVLDGLAAAPVPAPEPADTTDDLLGDLAAAAPEEPKTEDPLAALDSLGAVETAPEEVDDRSETILSNLADAKPAEAAADTSADVLEGLADAPISEPKPADTTDDLLGDLAAAAPDETEAEDPLAALDSLDALAEPPAETEESPEAVLSELAADDPTAADEDASADGLDGLTATPLSEPEPADTIDDLLGDLTTAAPDEAEDPLAALDALDMGSDAGAPAASSAEVAPDDPLAALDDLDSLDDMPGSAGADDLVDEPEPTDATDPLADLDSLLPPQDSGGDDPLADLDLPGADAAPEDAGLDDLLGDLDESPTEESDAGAADDLDDLLTGLGDADAPSTEADAQQVTGDGEDALAGLDDLLAEPAAADVPADPAAENLDDLLSDLNETAPATEANTPGTPAGTAVSGTAGNVDFGLSFGTLSSDRPTAQLSSRNRFRLAILGDFSGRAAKGLLETGDDLAGRPAILLDPDTVEDVIAQFATDLVLPLGKEGAGIGVSLSELDDLHPDELFENVELFSELVSLKRELSSGATADSAAKTLQQWGEAYGTPIAPPQLQSGGNAVPADRRLSDFQALIGDTGGKLTQASPLDELLARIVGPHVRAAPDADTLAMQKAVDDALSGAMRLLLHHPEFQSVEAQWRSIDLIARSIETDDTLDVMLYDVSAEEIATDLAMSDDLAQSGLARLLTEEPLDAENGRGGYSALIGLYTFEETPPHAELLGRIARVAAHIDAPFVSALSAGTLDTDKADRHPLTATAWDTLRGMPEAAYLGLAMPRFLLRRPYGAKSEPCYEFDFEEFTMQEGLRGMLWANPGVLVAILLARSFRQNGASMQLGSVMSLGEMPYHFITDQYGDQVALPCTERNLTLERVEKVVTRGLMPLVSIKGRDEIRLASFQSLGGGDLRGRWTGTAPPPPSPPPKTVDVDDLLADLDTGGDADNGAHEDLDALLAEFGNDNTADASAGSDMDADLASLLEDL